MKANETIAKVIAKVAMTSAKAACGAASYFGPYQPKEPANIKEIKKNLSKVTAGWISLLLFLCTEISGLFLINTEVHILRYMNSKHCLIIMYSYYHHY